MPVVKRVQGFPVLYADAPEETARLRAAQAKAEAGLPLLFETEMNSKKYRLRGLLNNGETSGSVVEWKYNGKWLRVRNYEIIDQVKELFYESNTAGT